MTTSAEIETAIQKMIGLGIMGRWWCARCEDWVPYRTALALEAIDGRRKRGIAYGETESRAAHAKGRHTDNTQRNTDSREQPRGD